MGKNLLHQSVTLKSTVRRPRRYWLLMAGILAAVVLFSCWLYAHDNKYTHQGPQGTHGLLQLTPEILTDYPVTWLIGGWEYYGNQLLSPEDFRQVPSLTPDAYVFIGQYPGFDRPEETDSSPHGSATYRLTIQLPDEYGSYTLELPEIYSACEIYLNDRLVRRYGDLNPSHYSPQTKSSYVEFQGFGQLEIIIAATDRSHVYSGLVYPPAFGLSEQVSYILQSRMVVRALACAAAVLAGIFHFITGLFSKSRQSLLLGFLCFCFIGFTAYPITRSLFLLPFTLSYALEHLCFLGVFFFAILLHLEICPVSRKWALLAAFGGLAACVPGICYRIFVSAGLLAGDAAVFNFHSTVISLYKYGNAAYLTLFTAFAAAKGAVLSRILLPGFLILSATLFMDRLLPLYEPILFGWFIEWGAFFLILSYVAAASISMVQVLRDRAVLLAQVDSSSRLISLQRSYFTSLTEKIDEAKAARHDFHHHVTVLHDLVSEGKQNELLLYLESLSPSAQSDAPLILCQNHIADILLNHYSAVARKKHIRFHTEVRIPQEIFLADADLAALLGNLLENAVEACSYLPEKSRFIRLKASYKKNALLFSLENSWDGYEGHFHLESRKRQEGRESGIGIGLVSLRSLAAAYGGYADFKADKEAACFTSTVTLYRPESWH